ncbi:hypothetical protein, partial [Klebsiella michiganensis]|uniref:hypothetical protein n=1 Tax=Klebsiella michiganensis TaxID=1134687 RepID=UPI0025507ABF
SPGKAFTPQPGEYSATWYCCGFFPARAALSRATRPQIAGNPGNIPRRGIAAASSRFALRLAGLPGRRLLVTRSPGKAFTPQPGEYSATWYC